MKAAPDRMTRINELLRREIAELLERRLEHKTNCLVTVTEVKTSSDLKHAKVYISVIGEQKGKESVAALLLEHRVFLQQEIARDIKIKYTPVLEFVYDGRVSAANKVLDIITQLEATEPTRVPPSEAPSDAQSR